MSWDRKVKKCLLQMTQPRAPCQLRCVCMRLHICVSVCVCVCNTFKPDHGWPFVTASPLVQPTTTQSPPAPLNILPRLSHPLCLCWSADYSGQSVYMNGRIGLQTERPPSVVKWIRRCFIWQLEIDKRDHQKLKTKTNRLFIYQYSSSIWWDCWVIPTIYTVVF